MKNKTIEKNISNYNPRHYVWNAIHKSGIEDPKKYIQDLYVSGKSCQHTAEIIKEQFNQNISSKGIEYYLDPQIKRSKSEAKKLAIKTGRMIYRKKQEHEKYKEKYVSAGIRLNLLKKAEFKCELCGNGRHNGYSIEIHRKDFNENNNNKKNFQVLCYMCYRGVHENNKE